MSESLSIVIAVYRSESILPELYRQLVVSLEKTGAVFEIIFVEDCGGDGSWNAIKDIASRDARVRGFRLRRNYGQHNALLCGIRIARHDVIVTMDDDLQHPPDQISTLLAKLDEGFDVVYGVPRTEQHGLLRNLASQFAKLALQTMMGADTARKVTAFRCFRTGLRDAFANYRSPTVFIDALLTWGTDRFEGVVVPHAPRRAGKSNYTFWKLFLAGLNMMTGFTVVPLRLAIGIGIAFVVFAMGVLVWVIGSYFLYGTSVQGFVFLATIITLFAGVQLLTLGIFGEYLGRIFGWTLDRPPFMIGERVEASKFNGNSPRTENVSPARDRNQ
jgi:undecaprenyl-phosphate 4-deoxy-4-formamido-L-arabinose transferase